MRGSVHFHCASSSKTRHHRDICDHGRGGRPTQTLSAIAPSPSLSIGFESSCSRRAEAIEPGGIIRPLGIAEVGRAAGQGVGAHWNPDGIGQVRGGFHHDDQVLAPVMVNPNRFVRTPKLASLVCTCGFHEHGRTTGKHRAPARGSRQVIDGRIGVTVEHIEPKLGALPLK